MNITTSDKYKIQLDSNISWIGHIPSHWKLKRLKDIGLSVIGITYSPDDVIANNDGFLVLRSSNIQNGELSLLDNIYVRKDKPINKKQILKKDDILICSRNGSRALIGKNICIDERVVGETFGAFMTVFRSKYYKFVSKYLNSNIFEEQSSLFGSSTVNQLTINTLNNFLIFLPPLSEQTAIANYLDEKTALIDKKINLLTQKADKYKELKQALINETVTKGLDRNVKLKDSDVKWLGKIPVHWAVKRAKDIFFQTRAKAGPSSSSYDVLSLTLKGVIKRDLETMVGKVPASFDTYQIAKKDNLILCLFDMDVTPRIIGYVNFEGIVTSAYTVLVSKKNTISKYYYYYYLEQNRNKSLLANSKTLRSTMTYDLFSQLQVPVPPTKEQTQIAEYLDKKTSQIDKIVESINNQIEKLKELRKTLINDVVTGKIKVTDE